MSFKKYLIKKRAQASIEYIILMVVLMGLLTVWLKTGGLFPNLRDNLKTNFFDKAVVKILDDGAEPPPPPPPCKKGGRACSEGDECCSGYCNAGTCE